MKDETSIEISQNLLSAAVGTILLKASRVNLSASTKLLKDVANKIVPDQTAPLGAV